MDRRLFVLLAGLFLAGCISTKERTCGICSGSGKAKCNTCHGEGKQACAACHGIGFRCCTPCERGQTQVLCQVCKGQGRTAICASCKGAAKIACVCKQGKAFNGSACVLCSGTGFRDCGDCIDGKAGSCGCCCGKPVTAELKAAHSDICGVCKGLAKVACRSCNGTLLAACSNCGGDGKIKPSSSSHHKHHDWD